MKWSPIIHPEQLAPAQALIKALAVKTIQSASHAEPTLFGGKVGVLILLKTLKNHDDELCDDDQFDHCLEQLFDSTGQFNYSMGLSNGLSGLGFGLDILGLNQLEDNNEDIDECLLGYLDSPGCNNDFDFLNGLTGIGLYGLCRNHKTTGQQIFSLVINKLQQSAIVTNDEIYWLTQNTNMGFKPQYGATQLNFGMAHGNLAVTGLLVKALEKNVQPDLCRTMLQQHCQWIIKHLNDETALSCLPSLIDINNHQNALLNSRLGWCFGDLSASVVLIRAARVLHDLQLESIAINIGLKSTTLTATTGRVLDGGLCHGSTGCTLMYQRLYHLTGRSEFKQAAQQWLNFTFKLVEQDPSFNSLMGAYHPQKDTNVALMDGYVGFCLSLIAAVGDDAPQWDAAFLLS